MFTCDPRRCGFPDHPRKFRYRPYPNMPNSRREALRIGRIDKTDSEVDEVIQDLRDEWHGNLYTLLGRNCNHFSTALCRKLTGKTIPSWVNRLAGMGCIYIQ